MVTGFYSVSAYTFRVPSFYSVSAFTRYPKKATEYKRKKQLELESGSSIISYKDKDTGTEIPIQIQVKIDANKNAIPTIYNIGTAQFVRQRNRASGDARSAGSQ